MKKDKQEFDKCVLSATSDDSIAFILQSSIDAKHDSNIEGTAVTLNLLTLAGMIHNQKAEWQGEAYARGVADGSDGRIAISRKSTPQTSTLKAE